MRTIHLIGLSLLALLLAAATAGAQDGYRRSPAARAEGAAADGQISREALREVLVNLGYKPETIVADDGRPYYKIAFERDGWNFNLYVSHSGDDSLIYVESLLGNAIDLTQVPPARLAALLAKNTETGLARFGYYAETQYLFVLVPLSNRRVSSAQLRQAIDLVTRLAIDSEDLWNPARWEDAPPAEPPAPQLTDLRVADAAPPAIEEGYVGADGDFRMQLPSTPERTTEEIETKFGNVTVTTYATTDAEGTTWIVATFDYPAELAREPASVLIDIDRDVVADAIKGKVIREFETTVSGRPGREVHFEIAPGAHCISRYVVVDGRLYRIAVGPVAPDTAPAAFDSFALLD